MLEELKKEVKERFDEYRMVYFATSLDGQPRVRPLTMVLLDDDFWVLTGTEDAKMKELKKNPMTEVCLAIEKDENKGYIRFTGKAVIIEDMDVKKKVAENIDYFKNYWKTHEDPGFTLLKMEFDEIEQLKPGDMLAKRYRF